MTLIIMKTNTLSTVGSNVLSFIVCHSEQTLSNGFNKKLSLSLYRLCQTSAAAQSRLFIRRVCGCVLLLIVQRLDYYLVKKQ